MGEAKATPRCGLAVCARGRPLAVGRRGRRRHLRPVLAGRGGRGSARRQVRDRQRRGHEGPPRADGLAARPARRGAARGRRRRASAHLRDSQPLPVRRARPRRPLRPRAAPRCHLPRPRRPGRAAQPRLVGLAAHRADDGRDRPHDRLRADRGRRGDCDARARLEARAGDPDPAAVRERRGLALLAPVRPRDAPAAGVVGCGLDPRRGNRQRHPRREGARRRRRALGALRPPQRRDLPPGDGSRQARRDLHPGARDAAAARDRRPCSGSGAAV